MLLTPPVQPFRRSSSNLEGAGPQPVLRESAGKAITTKTTKRIHKSKGRNATRLAVLAQTWKVRGHNELCANLRARPQNAETAKRIHKPKG